MTIEQIQPRLKNAIENNRHNQVVSIISNYHETISEAINSNNTEIIKLVLEAAEIQDKAKDKTVYKITRFLAVVENARKKSTELNSYQNKFKSEEAHTVTYPSESGETDQQLQASDDQSYPNSPPNSQKKQKLSLEVKSDNSTSGQEGDQIIEPQQEGNKNSNDQSKDIKEDPEQVEETEQHSEKSSEEELSSEEPKLESAGEEEPIFGVIPALDTGTREEKIQIPASRTGMTSGSALDEEEKKKRENAKLLASGDDKKEQNNRQFYAAVTAVCTIGAITFFAAASMYFMSAKKANPVLSTSSTGVIVSLYAIGTVFAIIAIPAAAQWYLTPSSKLESTDSKIVGNEKQL